MPEAIITDSDITGLAGVKGTTDQDWFVAMAAALSSAIERMTGRQFVQQSYTEFYDGNGKDKLYLRNGPLGSVTSVVMDGVAVPGFAFVVKEDYLQLRESVWNRGLQNIQVVYSGGFTEVPPDVKTAAGIWGAYLYSRRKTLGAASLGTQGMSINVDKSSIPAEALALLQPWIKVSGW